MIQGVVNAAYEPVVRLAVQGPEGHGREIEAVVDTGYNGYLTLPPGLVADLGLPFASIGWAFLADGSEVSFDVHYGTVLWDAHQRYIRVDMSDTTPLVGMRLLDSHSLYVELLETEILTATGMTVKHNQPPICFYKEDSRAACRI